MAAPSTNLDPETVSRAVASLLKWLKSQKTSKKSQLLFNPDDEPLRLVLSLKKIPSKPRLNPHLIPLPHSLSINPEVCLIANDSSFSPISQQIKTLNLPISETIPISNLKSDYKPFEARRKLMGSYDLFLADRKILPLLPRLIGNGFFKKKKQPLGIDLDRKGWPEQLKRCLNSSALYLRSGTCCQIDVGRASMEEEEIVENVIASVERAMDFVPGKWGNVRSVHLKFDDSVALPVFRAIPEVGLKIGSLVDEESGISKKRKRKEKKEKKEEKKKGKLRQPRYMDRISDVDIDVADDDGDDGEDLDGGMVPKKETKKVGKLERPRRVSIHGDDDEIVSKKEKRLGKLEKLRGVSNHDDDADDGEINGEMISKKRKTKKLGKLEKPSVVSVHDDGGGELMVKKRKKVLKLENPKGVSSSGELNGERVAKKKKKLAKLEKPRGVSVYDDDVDHDEQDGEKVSKKKVKKIAKLEKTRKISIHDDDVHDDDDQSDGEVSKKTKKPIKTVKPKKKTMKKIGDSKTVAEINGGKTKLKKKTRQNL